MPDADNVITIQALHKAFGGHQVLRGVSLEVPRATSLAVMGGSGTGKSVLLKHIVRLMDPDEGVIWVHGRRIDVLSLSELDALRLRIGFLFQGGALFDSMTVTENMDFMLRHHTSMTEEARLDRIMEALAWVNLQPAAGQFPAQLSGGQKKRIALARAIILEPDILLCDEPTTGLDPVSVRTVSELLVRLRAERDMTIVTITHDLLCAEITADAAVFLHEGRVLARGTIAQLKAHEHPELRLFFG